MVKVMDFTWKQSAYIFFSIGVRYKRGKKVSSSFRAFLIIPSCRFESRYVKSPNKVKFSTTFSSSRDTNINRFVQN